jgi:hypothetical protein
LITDHAEVVKLVDALDSKSSGGNPVTVRLRPSAPPSRVEGMLICWATVLVSSLLYFGHLFAQGEFAGTDDKSGSAS